jgi:hypothetical protein
MIVRLICFLLAFFYTTALISQSTNRFDVVIDELMPDPTPPNGLPNSEFVELKNVSANDIDLQGWKLSDGSATATINSKFILAAGRFVIICPNSAVAAFSVFGNTLGVSNFPSLNNDADVISLYSPSGGLIHSVAYSNTWYRNAVKGNGGWTLEMIDTKNPCQGASNWKSSIDPSGGTPGKINSVDGNNPDDVSPALLRTYCIDPLTITLIFDEPLDSSSAIVASHYILNNGIGSPVSARLQSPVFSTVILGLATKISPALVYNLTVNNVNDCAGNSVGIKNTARIGLSSTADSNDLAINELLFNPSPGGFDYVELYNRSKKAIDLKELYFANKDLAGNLINIKQVDTSSFLFFPGDYLVFTEDPLWLQQNYLVKDPFSIIITKGLPSLANDKGNLVLTNIQGNILDAVDYDEKWHFALIGNDEGVALERINYDQPAEDKNNWTSAASTAGNGTPGYQNSEFRADLKLQGQVTVNPTLFSPDNDGVNDFLSIQYLMPGPGYVANITIFDAGGRPVRYLARNATLGTKGDFRWDGVDDNLKKLPIGIYIIYTEVFNLTGKTGKFKNAITLARKF